MGTFSPLSEPSHPFYPLEATVVGYLANERSVVQLLAIFAISCVVVLGATLVLLRNRSNSICGADEAITLWFILCNEPYARLRCTIMWLMCSRRRNYTFLFRRSDLLGLATELSEAHDQSQATSRTITPQCLANKTFSGSCGRNIPTRTLDI